MNRTQNKYNQIIEMKMYCYQTTATEKQWENFETF